MKPMRTFALLFVLLSVSACSHMPRMESAHDTLSPAEHRKLGEAYLSHGEKKAAREQYEMALEGDSHSITALVSLGNIAFEENNLKKSRRYFREALKIDPGNAAIVNNLAMVDVMEGKHLTRAKALLDQALPTAGPTTPYLLDTLANIAILEGRMADASQALDQAEAAAPKSDADFPKHIQETREKITRRTQKT